MLKQLVLKNEFIARKKLNNSRNRIISNNQCLKTIVDIKILVKIKQTWTKISVYKPFVSMLLLTLETVQPPGEPVVLRIQYDTE